MFLKELVLGCGRAPISLNLVLVGRSTFIIVKLLSIGLV
jgi:hypothetical protein